MQQYKRIYQLRNALLLAFISTAFIYACGPSKKSPDGSNAKKSEVIKDSTKTGQAPPPPVKH